MTQKATFEKMIDLDSEVGVSAMKTIVGLVFEINGNDRYIKMALIKQNTTVLL